MASLAPQAVGWLPNSVLLSKHRERFYLAPAYTAYPDLHRLRAVAVYSSASNIGHRLNVPGSFELGASVEIRLRQ